MNKLSAIALVLAIVAPVSVAQASDHKALNAIPPQIMDAAPALNNHSFTAPVAAEAREVVAEPKVEVKKAKRAKKHAKKHAKKAAAAEVKADTAK